LYAHSDIAAPNTALERASALVVGVGALGCAAAAALADAGIGRITLVDDDVVDASNLQRQVLFDDSSIGSPKATVAATRLTRNARAHVSPRVERIDPLNVDRHLDGHDVVIDGTDDPETKYLLNLAAVRRRSLLVYGGVVRTGGLAMAISGGASACLACAFPERPTAAELGCDRLGVLAPVAGVIGSLQAYLALASLGGEHAIAGTLFAYELRGPRWRQLRFSRSRTCSVCGAAAAPAA
jgi:adenylyltransferase/sulfurtransferase